MRPTRLLPLAIAACVLATARLAAEERAWTDLAAYRTDLGYRWQDVDPATGADRRRNGRLDPGWGAEATLLSLPVAAGDTVGGAIGIGLRSTYARNATIAIGDVGWSLRLGGTWQPSPYAQAMITGELGSGVMFASLNEGPVAASRAETSVHAGLDLRIMAGEPGCQVGVLAGLMAATMSDDDRLNDDHAAVATSGWRVGVVVQFGGD